MAAMMSVSADTPKTAAFVLTLGINAWLRNEAERRGMSVSALVRELIERAMRDSDGKP